jgi:UDP-glucose-4-epimerase GalE
LRALVTGGAGYIGSHAVRALLDAGHAVRVLDDLSAGHREAVPAAVELVQADIADRAAVSRALDGCDAVLHFAALLSVGGSVRDPLAYWRNNVAKAVALIEAMDAAGVRRFVFSSTCATFGVPVRVPMDEDHPQAPINPYGASKLALERALRDLSAAGVLRAVALRYFNASGAHEDGSLGEDHAHEEHLIPLAIDAALGRRPPLTVFGEDYDTPDGTCIRDYIHVQDLAVAHVQALEALERGEAFQAYNLGTGRGHSVREVVDCVGRVLGTPVPHAIGARRAGDPPRLVAAADRARAAFGFAPRFTELGAIVETAARWRRDHPQGYRTRA